MRKRIRRSGASTIAASLALAGLAGAASGSCPEDLTGDGSVGGADLGTLLAAWGDCADPDDCPQDLTGNGNVGGADLGTLLAAWGDCPDDFCPDDAIEEGEPCGESLTGGCNMPSPGFGPELSCGDSVCGTSWAEDELRDTDWFPFTVADEPTQVTWTVEAQFDAVALIIGPGDCEHAEVIESASGHEASVSACLQPGDYWLFVAPNGFTGLPCDSGENQYVATVESCVIDPEVCDAPELSNCCQPTPGQAGCDDESCEAAVCETDPACCFEWDFGCAALAEDLCPDLCGIEPCETNCPPDGTPEGEPCGEDHNGGCNSDDLEFGSIACGETICGTVWADGGQRDTDWFLFEVSEPGEYTAELVSQFPGIVAIFSVNPANPDDCFEFVGTFGHSDTACSVGTATAELGTGTHAVFVAAGTEGGSGIFEGYPCDSGFNDYTVTLQCADGR